jgi:hypothetical protein
VRDRPFQTRNLFSNGPLDGSGGGIRKDQFDELTQITLVAVISAAFLGPAFAAASMSQAEMDALKGEVTQAGKTDQERMAFWKTMKPERQAAWKAECAAEVGMSQKDMEIRGDIPSLCKSLKGAM